MSTVTFARSKIVDIECPDENTFLVHGILDDYVYALELDVEAKLPDFKITNIQGRMKRYTTPECPKAIAKKIRRVVGREGCTHFANLLIECCDGIMQAAAYGEWKELEQKKAAPQKEEYLREKFESIPGLEDSCMVYSRMGK